MAWSKWIEHNGKGYPAPVGSRVQCKHTMFREPLEGLIGESGLPESQTCWSWRRVDGYPVCWDVTNDPIIYYRLWFDGRGTWKQVQALKDMIKYDVIADLIVKNPEELDT